MAEEMIPTPRNSVTACPACESGFATHAFDSAAQMHESREGFSFARCRDCGVLYLSSRPTWEALGHFYPDTYLPYRGEKAWGVFGPLVRFDQTRLDEKRVRAVEKAFRFKNRLRVLDVGCGKPTFLKALKRKQPNAECWGLDFKVSGWAGQKEFKGLNLVEGEVKNAPLSGTFDVITLWHYLEHDAYPLETLRHLQRFAHADTVLLVEVPNALALSHRVFGPRWAGLHTPRHMVIYSPSQLESMLRRTGWRAVRPARRGTLMPYLLWWLSFRELFSTKWDRSMVRYLPEFVLGAVLLFPLTALPFFTKDTFLLDARREEKLGRPSPRED